MDTAVRTRFDLMAALGAAHQALVGGVYSGGVSVEDPLYDHCERLCRVTLGVRAVGDPAPSPRVPRRWQFRGSSAGRLLTSSTCRVRHRVWQNDVTGPCQLVHSTDNRGGVVVEALRDACGDDQVVPCGAVPVRSATQCALPERVKPLLRRDPRVAGAASLRGKAGHRTMVA
jgi:hypothetical protein